VDGGGRPRQWGSVAEASAATATVEVTGCDGKPAGSTRRRRTDATLLEGARPLRSGRALAAL